MEKLYYNGSSTFTIGSTSFGYYDNDLNFQLDSDKVIRWVTRQIGFPIVEVELTNEQHDIFKNVVEVSSSVKDENGISYPMVMASICLTESSFGQNLKNSKAHGVMQVQLDTAKLVGKINKKYEYINNTSDKEILKKLKNEN